MEWRIQEHEFYSEWFDAQEEGLQDEILAVVGLLKREGPLLSRPHADTLAGSEHPNLKELRVQYQGEPCRIMFAFDPKRSAILLIGGNKTGNRRWYKENIPLADARFAAHLKALEKAEKERKNGDIGRTDGPPQSSKKGKNRGPHR